MTGRGATPGVRTFRAEPVSHPAYQGLADLIS